MQHYVKYVLKHNVVVSIQHLASTKKDPIQLTWLEIMLELHKQHLTRLQLHLFHEITKLFLILYALHFAWLVKVNNNLLDIKFVNVLSVPTKHVVLVLAILYILSLLNCLSTVSVINSDVFVKYSIYSIAPYWIIYNLIGNSKHMMTNESLIKMKQSKVDGFYLCKYIF